MKKDLKRFMELTSYNYDLMSTKKKLMEEFIKPIELSRYSHRLSEMNSLIESDTIEEGGNMMNHGVVVNLIRNKNFDVNDYSSFGVSLKSGNRGEFLTDYTLDEYGKMTTFKVKGFNIGFAIKSDGDIVSVHNNSGISGIGKDLIKSAIEMGGRKLDHFDGFLTGFYSGLGFKVVSSEDWNDDYAPSDWKYAPIDIFNPMTSIYANELKKYKTILSTPDFLKAKIEFYKQGKPDIVYREL